MERVEDLMSGLKLSEADMMGLKIGGKEVGVGAGLKGETVDAKALGKVFSEKPVSAEGVSQALGRIWCPLRGIRCRSMGENIFMFTFLQASGKRKALDTGPWNFNNDLVVVADFDPDKALEEYGFNIIPIWSRVLKLPLGRMERVTGEMIGEKIGEYVEVEVGEDGYAVGDCLRVKVKLNINNPLMRGMMMQFGDEERARWCPFEYEFLPEFCYTCGIIGHEARHCAIKLTKGEKQQFGPWLRAFMPKKTSSNEKSRWSGGGGSSSGGRAYGFGDISGRGGSNNLSWRKEGRYKSGSAGGRNKEGVFCDEATNPLGKTTPESRTENAERKSLEFSTQEQMKDMERTGDGTQEVQFVGTELHGVVQDPGASGVSTGTVVDPSTMNINREKNKQVLLHASGYVKEREAMQYVKNGKRAPGRSIENREKEMGPLSSWAYILVQRGMQHLWR